jgi:hypothetical protein
MPEVGGGVEWSIKYTHIHYSRIADEAEPKAVVRLFEKTAVQRGLSLKLRK